MKIPQPASDDRRAAAVVATGLLLLLQSCATGAPSGPDPSPENRVRMSVEDVQAYLDEKKPEPATWVRASDAGWTYLNDHFVLIQTSNGPHLAEFLRQCKDLDADVWYADMVDRRSSSLSGVLRAGTGTIRGCRIKKFYKLPDADAVQLTEASEANP